MLKINNLEFEYENSFSMNIPELNIEKKKINVVIGPNGSGKSTIGKIISGLIKNFKGEITIDGKNIKDFSKIELSKKITYMNKRLIRDFNITVYEFVATGRFPHKNNPILFQLNKQDEQIVRESLTVTDMSDKKDRFLFELSDGELQRAYLAKTLTQKTDYTVLDEPTSNLDVNHTVQILNLLIKLKEDTTFLVILHNLNEALHIFDRLIAMKNGEISFVWNKQEDFDLQKIENLYKINLKVFCDRKPVIYY